MAYEAEHIDPAAFADWDGLTALIHAAFAPVQRMIDPPSSAMALTSEAVAETARAETLFVVREGDALLGCVFSAPKDDALNLGTLSVAPKCQRRGVARALITAAEKAATAQGLRALTLETRVELAGTHAAFEHMGFRETGRRTHPGFYVPTGIAMRKPLDGRK